MTWRVTAWGPPGVSSPNMNRAAYGHAKPEAGRPQLPECQEHSRAVSLGETRLPVPARGRPHGAPRTSTELGTGAEDKRARLLSGQSYSKTRGAPETQQAQVVRLRERPDHMLVQGSLLGRTVWGRHEWPRGPPRDSPDTETDAHQTQHKGARQPRWRRPQGDEPGTAEEHSAAHTHAHTRTLTLTPHACRRQQRELVQDRKDQTRRPCCVHAASGRHCPRDGSQHACPGRGGTRPPGGCRGFRGGGPLPMFGWWV